MIAEIHVTLKPTLMDAQGKTTLRALQQLGHDKVRDVRIGKLIHIQMSEGLSASQLEAEIDLMCRQLLANPVIEDYRIVIDGETRAAGAPFLSTQESNRIITSEADTVPRAQSAPATSAPATAAPAVAAAAGAIAQTQQPHGHLSASGNDAAPPPISHAPAVMTPSMLPPDAPGATPVPRESFPEAPIPDTPLIGSDEAIERAAVEARPDNI